MNSKSNLSLLKARARRASCGVLHGIMLALLIFPGTPGLFASEVLVTGGIAEYREIDGGGNNPDDFDTGRAQSILIRVAPAAYGNGTDLPRGVPTENDGDGNIEADEQTLPNPRDISNLVHDQQGEVIPSGRRLNQLVFQFGQFLSHDTSLSEPNAATPTGGATGLAGNEKFAVPITDDPVFTFTSIPLARSVAQSAATSPTGVREQINTLTAFIDGSQVYGSDVDRAAALRTFEGGLLKVSEGPDGELMPYNTEGLANGNAFRISENDMFLAGDVRANEQIGLIAMHTLWVREHNRVAREIADNEFYGEDLTDGSIDEEIYQRARAVVVALLQKVTYYEWLPALIGKDCLEPYYGYNPSVNPQIANEFTTAAFRIGHTMLPPVYTPLLEDGSEYEISLLEAFFNPFFVTDNGIDDFLRGQATNGQQEVDRFVTDEVRSFLFGPGFGGLDLTALNIQRGRDHGLPDINTTRSAYGLSPVGDFLELTGDPDVAAALVAAYGEAGLEEIDLWTGGLCEPHPAGTNIGETFTTIFVDQFTRLRDGDRFYFENSEIYPYEFIETIHHTTFADIIRRNTSIEGDEVNDYAFFTPYFHPWQPDLRIGRDSDYSYRQGDDLYNHAGAGQTVRIDQSRRKQAKVHLSLENDGSFVNQMRLASSQKPGRQYLCHHYDTTKGGRQNISADLKAGHYEPVLGPGEMRQLESHVKVNRCKKQKRSIRPRLAYYAEHYYDSRGHDATTASLWFR